MSVLKKKSFPICAAIGMGAALLLTALLLLPVSAAVESGALDMGVGRILAYVCVGMSVLVPSAVIARVRGRQALATGGVIALGCALLAALCCALAGERCAFGPWAAYTAAALAVGALAGALLGVRQNSHKKRRRRS